MFPSREAPLRVCVVQAAPAAFDLAATLDRVESLAREAGGEGGGADLVVFPEAFVSGYPKGADFGVRVGSRTEAGRDLFQRYHASALEVPGKETERIAHLAAELGSTLLLPVIEREGGTLYCTALFFTPEDGLVARHRKLVPTAMERVIWGRGDGTTMPVVPTPAGRVGAAICWENYMPLYRTWLYQQGVELYCAPTVDDREVWLATMRHVAVEGRCFVLSACQYATRADFPADYPSSYGDDPDAVLIGGGSVIVDPYGQVLAGPERGGRAILRATLDPAVLARARMDLDTTGHYARPDVFHLAVTSRASHDPT